MRPSQRCIQDAELLVAFRTAYIELLNSSRLTSDGLFRIFVARAPGADYQSKRRDVALAAGRASHAYARYGGTFSLRNAAVIRHDVNPVVNWEMSLRNPDDLSPELVLSSVDSAIGTAEQEANDAAHLDRLRRWEPWAQADPDVEGLRAFTRSGLASWVEGRSLPCVILSGDAVVGATGASINGYAQTAELGYWIDADHEGRGAVSRAVTALLTELFQARGIRRVEIRTAEQNRRSRALAERHGFRHEGTLRSALPVGRQRHDVAAYGLLAEDWPASARPD